jgi:hypothetical protein
MVLPPGPPYAAGSTKDSNFLSGAVVLRALGRIGYGASAGTWSRRDVEALMKGSEDSVMVVDLGSAGDASRFLFLGRHEKLPSSDAVIV